jgi:NAD(P)-dependent dehydrogenase (short-subunit alcohol dehydrogenase family)
MSGLVARSIMEMPEGRQRFRDECSRLLRLALVPVQLTARVDEKVAALARELSPDESAALGREGGALKERIVHRLASVQRVPRYEPCDLTDVKQLRATIAAIEADFGSIDVLVNNAPNDDRHALVDVTPPPTAA